LKTEHIAKHFSTIQKEIDPDSIDDMIKLFAEFPGYNEDEKYRFLKILDLDDFDTKSENFLLEILNKSEESACLLQDALRQTEQTHLVKKLTGQRTDTYSTYCTEFKHRILIVSMFLLK